LLDEAASNKAAMSQPTLSTLPVEIKCQIMEVSDCLSTVLALAQTATTFQQAWQSHTKAICRKVLPRSLECYADGQSLVDIQFSVKATTEAPETEATLSILRLKRIVANSHAATNTCDFFARGLGRTGATLGPYQIKRPAKPFLTPTERARFIHAYYLARIFLFAKRLRSMKALQGDWADDFLAAIPPRELWQVRELMSWLEMMNGHGLQLHVGSLASAAGFAAFRVSFRNNFRSLADRDPYAPGSSQNVGISSFFDECQHYLESLSDTVLR
jgi:hypothetical protein